MTDEPIEEPKTGSKPIPLRMKVLIGLLALMGVAFGVNAAHIHALENELREIADTKESEWTRGENRAETVSIVTATKEYLIYGKVHGKIEVFVKKEENRDRLMGIDYFFSRDDGEWSETESGMCTAEECQVRGAKAFAGK